MKDVLLLNKKVAKKKGLLGDFKKFKKLLVARVERVEKERADDLLE